MGAAAPAPTVVLAGGVVPLVDRGPHAAAATQPMPMIIATRIRSPRIDRTCLARSRAITPSGGPSGVDGSRLANPQTTVTVRIEVVRLGRCVLRGTARG